MAGEILAHRLASIHNLYCLLRLASELREAIGTGRLKVVVEQLRATWGVAALP
jgi:tRNA-guanine family transglycosylase